ncbi:MAG: hypothetical protein J6N46_08585 [Bacteroidales bacterium]|nr:hypothetical protein [Bacteroidales bacterium]
MDRRKNGLEKDLLLLLDEGNDTIVALENLVEVFLKSGEDILRRSGTRGLIAPLKRSAIRLDESGDHLSLGQVQAIGKLVDCIPVGTLNAYRRSGFSL